MQEFGEFQDATQPDNEWDIRAAVIRVAPGTNHQDPDDPDLLLNDGLTVYTNAAHTSTGVIKVGIQKNSGRITIVTDGSRMGAVIVTGDETAARNRLMFGGSSGVTNVNIEVSDPNGRADFRDNTEYNRIAYKYLNLWVAWFSPKVRGIGAPSKADRALARIADLEARVDALEGQPPSS